MTALPHLAHPAYGLQVLRLLPSDAAWPTGLDLPATDAAAAQRGYYLNQAALDLFAQLQADVPEPMPKDFTIEVATIGELGFARPASLQQAMDAAAERHLVSFPLQYAAALRMRYGAQRRGNELYLAVDEPMGDEVMVVYLRHGNRQANALLAKSIGWETPLSVETRFVFARPCPIN